MKGDATSRSNIQFNYYRTTFRIPKPNSTSAWIEKVVDKEGSDISSLSYVFCTDAYLLSINQHYLHHNTLTDIITFDLSDNSLADSGLEGEIYVSVPRVRENARTLGISFDEELHRVIIHGALHLLGYGDKTAAQKADMRKRESSYLSLRK